MCRNIKVLRNASCPPSEEEITLAALQFVRKVSGYRSPSRANKMAFDAAVVEIAASTQRLLESLVAPAMPGGREADGGSPSSVTGHPERRL